MSKSKNKINLNDYINSPKPMQSLKRRDIELIVEGALANVCQGDYVKKTKELLSVCAKSSEENGRNFFIKINFSTCSESDFKTWSEIFINFDMTYLNLIFDEVTSKSLKQFIACLNYEKCNPCCSLRINPGATNSDEIKSLAKCIADYWELLVQHDAHFNGFTRYFDKNSKEGDWASRLLMQYVNRNLDERRAQLKKVSSCHPASSSSLDQLEQKQLEEQKCEENLKELGESVLRMLGLGPDSPPEDKAPLCKQASQKMQMQSHQAQVNSMPVSQMPPPRMPIHLMFVNQMPPPQMPMNPNFVGQILPPQGPMFSMPMSPMPMTQMLMGQAQPRQMLPHPVNCYLANNVNSVFYNPPIAWPAQGERHYSELPPMSGQNIRNSFS